MSQSTLVDNATILDVTNNIDATSAVYNVVLGTDLSIQINATDTTADPQTFVAADVNINPANSITITDHGFITGLKVVLSGTNLPSGLSATTYYIIVVDEDTIKLANSLAHALAGTAVTITTQGTTADAELTPDTLDQTIKLQQSCDGITYFDVSGDSENITGDTNALWVQSPVTTQYYKVVLTVVAGSMDCEVLVNLFNRGYSL